MKILSCVLVLMASTAFVLMGCSDNPASLAPPADQGALEQGSLQKATTVPYTATHYPLEVLDPGKVVIVDGGFVMKNVLVRERMNSANPMVNGIMIHSLTQVFDAMGEGPCHGTFTMTPDADMGGGVWEGKYEGYRTRIGGQVFSLPLTVTGLGRGGTLENLKLNADFVLTVFGTPPTYWYGSGEGYITIHSLTAPSPAN